MPMSTNPIRYTFEAYLKPLFPEKSRPRGINLAPNAVYPAGAVLIPSSGSANDVQTIAVTGSPTGGTYTLTGINPITGAPFTTAAIAYNANDAAVQSAIAAAIGTASGGTVTVSSLAVTFGGAFGNQPVALMTLGTNALTGGSSPTVTVTHTTTGSTAGQFSLYAAAGSGTPTCVNAYACATDGAGNVTFGGQSGGAYLTGATYPYAMAYFGGSFQTSDLSGLDSNAVTKLGRLSSGTTSSGILEIIGF